NRRTNERKRDPPHHAELVGAEGLGRFFERGIHAFQSGGHYQERQGSQNQGFDEDQPRHGIDIKWPLFHAEQFYKQAIIKPLLGLSSMTQEIETRMGGRMLGTIAVNSKIR